MKNKVLLLNLPNKEQITRRYMCSYVSPESLMPPLELISLGAVAREWHGAEVQLIDAIAEKLDGESTMKRIHQFAPNLIVSITGFECFEEDMDMSRLIKKNNEQAKLVLFGHYATTFPKETLTHSSADFVIMGEGDLIFHDLLTSLFGSKPLTEVKGVVYKSEEQFVVQGAGERIPNPNELPIPCYDLLPKEAYYEPLMARPYGMIQTSRGCPYQCNFCVKSYGSKLTTLSVDRMIKEIKLWKQLHDIRSLRFIDDTFTVDKKRVIELCKRMIEEQFDLKWACLSRTDNIDRELLEWMKRAGCYRIYFGMESGSKRMLEMYHKKFTLEESLEAFSLCREENIESAAFFMSGHPQESEDDFQKTLAFVRKSELNFASFNPLTPYPGTSLFTELREGLDFSIYPYQNTWKDKTVYQQFTKRKKTFYRKFYLRPSYVLKNRHIFISHFKEFLAIGVSLVSYVLLNGKSFVISGLKGADDE